MGMLLLFTLGGPVLLGGSTLVLELVGMNQEGSSAGPQYRGRGGKTGSPHTLISNIIGMWCVRGTEFFEPVSWSQRYGKSSGTLARDASKDKGYFG